MKLLFFWLALWGLSACSSCKKTETASNEPAPASKATAPSALKSACSAPTLKASRLAEPIKFDGKMADPVWGNSATSGAFLGEGTGEMKSPHSEFRAAWSEQALTLGLFAADEDFEPDDAFVLRLMTAGGSPLTWQISAQGQLFCVAPPGVRCRMPEGVEAKVDIDGTFDDRTDMDEEWMVELVVPWSALELKGPPSDVKMNVWRTDTPRGASPRTVAWACASTAALGTVELVSQATGKP
jgi:hypothetical protein